MMIDAFQPQGITRLAVDSIFMMPQLGVLASVQPEAAGQVFERDCLIWLGTVVAPVGVASECIKIAPPLDTSREALDEGLAVLGEAMDEVLD
jgi:hypothetical protein